MDQLLLIIIQNQPVRHRQVVLTRLCLNTVWILYSKIKLTMNLYGLLHQYPLCVIRLYKQHLSLLLVQPIIVHSIFWLWTVQCWVLSWLPWKQRCVVRWWHLHLILRMNCNHWKNIIMHLIDLCIVERYPLKNRNQTLCEMCPNRELFLVRIFPHSDWIRRDTKYLSVFNPNGGK